MRLDDQLGLKHPDPEAFLFCRLKWPKQRFADKFRTHPTAGIAHRHDHPVARQGRGHRQAPLLPHRLPSIDQQIRHHRGQLPQALQKCEERLAVNPKDEGALRLLGIVANQQGDQKKSLEAYERLLKNDVRYRFVIDMASLE